jgi:hypothetical protein
MENVTITKFKLQQLLNNFYDVCSLCDECDIYEHEGLDESMQDMKDWVSFTFGRNIDKEKYE